MENTEYETTAVTPLPDRPDLKRKRSAAVFSFMAVIFVVLTIRIAVLASASERGGRWRMFILPALRGRILDADGRPLAWSTHVFSVTYRRPESELETWQDLRDLEERCGWKAVAMARLLKNSTSAIVVLKDNVAPAAVLDFQRDLWDHPRLKLKHGFRRHYCEGLDGRLSIWMGETRQFGWREVGISGMEKKLNRDLLSGADGKILVLVDDDGDWISGTERRIQERRPGYDRSVDFRMPR